MTLQYGLTQYSVRPHWLNWSVVSILVALRCRAQLRAMACAFLCAACNDQCTERNISCNGRTRRALGVGFPPNSQAPSGPVHAAARWPDLRGFDTTAQPPPPTPPRSRARVANRCSQGAPRAPVGGRGAGLPAATAGARCCWPPPPAVADGGGGHARSPPPPPSCRRCPLHATCGVAAGAPRRSGSCGLAAAPRAGRGRHGAWRALRGLEGDSRRLGRGSPRRWAPPQGARCFISLPRPPPHPHPFPLTPPPPPAAGSR